MNWTYKNTLKTLNSGKNADLLKGGNFGIERECLRIDENGEISYAPHPQKLGSALTHPLITTDFSEAQLELITPPQKSLNSSEKLLEEIHTFIIGNLKKEQLWPLSMPAKLPKKPDDIPIANYGTSNQGKKKTIYRRGLALRYGPKMQTISGIHFNFSYGEKFWQHLHQKFAAKDNLQDFVSEQYFATVRNFLRYNWLNTYLFGASPAACRTFFESRPKQKLKKLKRHTAYGKYATSLRMSKTGYSNKSQCQYSITHNSLKDFVDALEYGITTPKKQYEKLGLEKNGEKIQLNANVLQIENEHYSFIRPKQPAKHGESVIEALRDRGVSYLEIRSIDLNPYNPLGLNPNQLDFLQILLLYCTLQSSPKMSKDEYCKEVVRNQDLIATTGRDKKLKLVHKGKKIKMQDFASNLLKDMKSAAKLLDKAYKTTKFTKNLEEQQAKVLNPELTPSYQILHEMLTKQEGHLEFGLRLANRHFQELRKKKISAATKKKFQNLAKESFETQEKWEYESQFFVDGYEDMEISTQIVIREAQNRKVQIEVLDRHDNFIRLIKGKKIEYVKQATKTDFDSYMTFLLMENKIVSKKILEEHGLSVPQGHTYTDIFKAEKKYHRYARRKIVVKPTSTNFGIGVSFAESEEEYKKALQNAFQHDESIIVEDFISGKEYRFLVIGDQVAAIVYRVPANVKGDGKSTITELVEMKNRDPDNRKIYFTEIGKYEKDYLAAQNLKPSSIIKKGRTVYFRENSNVSTGGDAHDYTDKIPNSYKKLAIKAAQSVNAKFCGVDMIISNPNVWPAPDNYAIIEINFNPALAMHNFPYRGENRNVGAAVLDLLGF